MTTRHLRNAAATGSEHNGPSPGPSLLRYTAQGIGLLAGVGAGMLSYAFLHEPLQVEMERLTIRLPNAAGRLPRGGLRILHLSDTHFQGRNWRERRKIERIRKLTAGMEYDLLIHTGDFVHYDEGLANVVALLNAIPQPRLGSYAVLGNHDYSHYDMGAALPRMWASYRKGNRVSSNGRAPRIAAHPGELADFARYVRNTPLDGKRTGHNDTQQLTSVLRAHQMDVLHNYAIHLCHRPGEADGVDIYLAGVDDVVEGRPHIAGALDGIPADAPTILLSHNPDIVESPRLHQVDLVLSGHTHGGQIVLPFWGPAHTQAEYLERKNVAGYLRKGPTQIYITRGIGEGIPLRFAAKPQFALITILPETD